MNLLPPELLRQLEARRGHAFAYRSLEACKTALVAVDLTTMFFGDSRRERDLAERVNRIARHLRAGGGAVLWVRPAPFAHGALMQELLGPKLAAMHEEAQREEDARNQLSPLLEIEPGDLHVRKRLFSTFFPGSSDAEAQLGSRGIENVLVAGVVTDVCVEATARDAFSCGFRTVLVADATIGSSEAAQAVTLATFHRLFGDVRAAEEVLEIAR